MDSIIEKQEQTTSQNLREKIPARDGGQVRMTKNTWTDDFREATDDRLRIDKKTKQQYFLHNGKKITIQQPIKRDRQNLSQVKITCCKCNKIYMVNPLFAAGREMFRCDACIALGK